LGLYEISATTIVDMAYKPISLLTVIRGPTLYVRNLAPSRAEKTKRAWFTAITSLLLYVAKVSDVMFNTSTDFHGFPLPFTMREVGEENCLGV
jgi:hypothetical protein